MKKRISLDAKHESERLHKEFEAETRRIEAEKAALRRIEITGGDEVDLGLKSSGWNEYKENLKEKLMFLKRAKIHRADKIANTFNKSGFKTGSGRPWTARLVKIAKIRTTVD